ncbi:MAG TPA: hypothetical protein VFK85_08315 [Anaeromyxobacteraceae bacterium]|nr:hypothetical protein [Anaeromyxobacteraceae bacterium]
MKTSEGGCYKLADEQMKDVSGASGPLKEALETIKLAIDIIKDLNSATGGALLAPLPTPSEMGKMLKGKTPA